MINGVTHAHLGPIWYNSEPSDVPYSPNQFLGWDFFCSFLQQDGYNEVFIVSRHYVRMEINGLKIYESLKFFLTKLLNNFAVVETIDGPLKVTRKNHQPFTITV